jgi:hypothetical protein
MAAGTPPVYPPVFEIPEEEKFKEGDKPLIELIGEEGMAIIDAMVGHTDEDEQHDGGKKDDSKVEHCEPLVESPPKRVKLGH